MTCQNYIEATEDLRKDFKKKEDLVVSRGVPHIEGLEVDAQGYLLLNLWEDEGQEEVPEDKDEEERKVKLMKRSRKSERTLNSCMRHGDDHGME